MVIDYNSKNKPLKFGDDWLYKLRGIANPSLLCPKIFLMSKVKDTTFSLQILGGKVGKKKVIIVINLNKNQ